jgi:hypothetical protein
MATDPADRYQTVQALAAALARSAAEVDGAPAGELVGPPPAPTGPEVTPARGFLRHEGRWLGWTLVLVAVAAVLVAVGLTLASEDLGNLGNLFRDDRPRVATPSKTTVASDPIRGITATAYDPLGNDGGRENDQDAPKAVDGDAATAWETSTYRNRPDLGGLKDGVGLVLDPGAARQARTLTLDLTAAGTDFTVYATDDATVPGSIDGWQELTSEEDADDKLTVELSGGPHRYYLVWFTKLAPADGGYRIGVAEAGLRS